VATIQKMLRSDDFRYRFSIIITKFHDFEDLQKHFIIMNKFKSILALGEVDFADESNRLLSLSTALKCAGSYFPFFLNLKNIKLKIFFFILKFLLKILDMEPKDLNCIRNGVEE